MVHISEREEQLPDAVIGKLLKIAAEDKNVISLSVGEPDFITPKPILDHAKSVIKKSTHYSPTQGLKELRESISKKLKKENKINANPDNIVVTVGSQEAMFGALLCTLDPGEDIIVPNPSYLAYTPAIELVNAVPNYVKLEEEDGFEINPDRIRQAINKKKTKAIIINSPSNPTGNVLNKKTLEEIADIAVENDLYVFSDEAYEKLVYDKKHISIGSLNGMKKYVITLQTFSKSYAMCGFRVGYMHAPSNITSALIKSLHYVTLSASTLSQNLALKALTISNKYTEDMKKEYNKRRLYIVKRLNDLGLRTRTPNGAFYAFANIKHLKMKSYNFADKLLKKSKVAVVPGTEFGKYGEGYIRFSYATDLSKIKTGLDRVEKFINKI
ncbi:aromatic amino acid aminotransferase [archaeon]|nr:aromatic amino acid aminotransferase [archaeon]|tara:strand:+ start:107 stop:1258 length:1152 start_codon:yes stop_codon:yes gene_type:complete